VDGLIIFIRGWLSPERFKKICNIPMKFIPNFSWGNGSVYNAKFGRAVQKHMQLMAFGTRHMVSLNSTTLMAAAPFFQETPHFKS
jgi:hypothetical protein